MRKHVKEIGKFFVFVAIFFALTSPFVVLFGPFDNLKRTVVGAILKSRHPQYITWLFSQEEIDEILGGISSTPKQELFKFKARTDSTLTLKNIDSSRFKGFLLEIPDPHRVQVATAENMDEKGDTTSGIAERVGAVAAINAGGFYDATGPVRAASLTVSSSTMANISSARMRPMRKKMNSSASPRTATSSSATTPKPN